MMLMGNIAQEPQELAGKTMPAYLGDDCRVVNKQAGR